MVAKISTELPTDVNNLLRNLKSLASYTGKLDIHDILYIKIYNGLE